MLSTQKLTVDLWDKVYGRESGEAQDVDEDLYGGFLGLVTVAHSMSCVSCRPANC